MKWVIHGHEILATDVMKWDRGYATIMKEVWSKCYHVHMEIWNLKSSHKMYYEFEVKFGLVSNIFFGHTIYCFEA